ncbi:hypothetical protein [Streptomyces noursei]|uniref:hypothetical protein n=1 Tax=Streptomyces noursei TaxID=1971 RepID=UPI001965BC74|nr:hypothetical protein [Streptomyces noursei]QRX90833.1 hypothetical protein JNO44_08335 [Streptomyces noursei]
MTARAVVALLAGELYDLHPDAYDGREHPVAPAAVQAAEHLLDALAEHGLTITTNRAA